MKITELNIGDVVCDNNTKFPMTVVGLFADSQDRTKGVAYLDFEGNEDDIWEEDATDIELIRKYNCKDE